MAISRWLRRIDYAESEQQKQRQLAEAAVLEARNRKLELDRQGRLDQLAVLNQRVATLGAPTSYATPQAEVERRDLARAAILDWRRSPSGVRFSDLAQRVPPSVRGGPSGVSSLPLAPGVKPLTAQEATEFATLGVRRATVEAQAGKVPWSVEVTRGMGPEAVTTWAGPHGGEYPTREASERAANQAAGVGTYVPPLPEDWGKTEAGLRAMIPPVPYQNTLEGVREALRSEENIAGITAGATRAGRSQELADVNLQTFNMFVKGALNEKAPWFAAVYNEAAALAYSGTLTPEQARTHALNRQTVEREIDRTIDRGKQLAKQYKIVPATEISPHLIQKLIKADVDRMEQYRASQDLEDAVTAYLNRKAEGPGIWTGEPPPLSELITGTTPKTVTRRNEKTAPTWYRPTAYRPTERERTRFYGGG